MLLIKGVSFLVSVLFFSFNDLAKIQYSFNDLAEKFIKNKSKFYQKSLTQAWDFLNFLNEKDYCLILFQAPDLEKF